MTTTPCTEHTACLTPPRLTVDDIAVVQTVSELTGESYHAIQHQGRTLATFLDRGFYQHPVHGGGWFHRWEAFMGGNAVYLPRHIETGDADAVVRHLVDEIRRVSFQARMALHAR